jgi:putative Holliday junction resolvase
MDFDPVSHETNESTYLGFDFGEKNIGVAVGQRVTGTATALETIRVTSGKALWDAISRLVQTWRAHTAEKGARHAR